MTVHVYNMKITWLCIISSLNYIHLIFIQSCSCNNTGYISGTTGAEVLQAAINFTINEH